jgi:hypothetical protein
MIDEIAQRMRQIITDRPNSSASDLRQCIDNLLEQPVSAQQLDLAERLLTGKFTDISQLIVTPIVKTTNRTK